MHLRNKFGGLGLVSVENRRYISTITHFFRCLTCPDDLVNCIAWDQLKSTIMCRTRESHVTLHDIENFLNAVQKTRVRDVQSVWSVVRKSLSALGLRVGFDDENWPLLESEVEYVNYNGRRGSLNNLLNSVVEDKQLKAVLASSPVFCVFSLYLTQRD